MSCVVQEVPAASPRISDPKMPGEGLRSFVEEQRYPSRLELDPRENADSACTSGPQSFEPQEAGCREEKAGRPGTDSAGLPSLGGKGAGSTGERPSRRCFSTMYSVKLAGLPTVHPSLAEPPPPLPDFLMEEEDLMGEEGQETEAKGDIVPKFPRPPATCH